MQVQVPAPDHPEAAALLQFNLRRPNRLRATSRSAWITWSGICVVGALLLPIGTAARSIVLAPLLEETVFRHGIHDALSTRLPSGGVRFAPVLTALAFASLHLLFAADSRASLLALATAIPAWWIGALYERDRRLGPCVAWHAAFNLAWLCGLHSLAPTLTGT